MDRADILSNVHYQLMHISESLDHIMDKVVDQRRSGIDLLGVNIAGDCITMHASLIWVVT